MTKTEPIRIRCRGHLLQDSWFFVVEFGRGVEAVSPRGVYKTEALARRAGRRWIKSLQGREIVDDHA